MGSCTMTPDGIGLIGVKDKLQEISMRLEKSHLAYLQLDNSPSKLEARHKLEGFIKEYLYHVPNERKYIFQETADILHRSASTVKDFSGYRACTAWRAISLYAANLLAQSWRKEYRTLRTYSGYYKHEVEKNLIGAELMFELMGYKHTGLGVLTLEGPIDPDKVSNVSRDAIVAFVECQILQEIWESVSQNFTISWLDVLEFRFQYVGTPEQAIRALNFRFHERSQQMREKTSSLCYRDYRHVPPMGIDPTLSALTPTTIPYHYAMSNNYNTGVHPGICKPDSVYPTDGHFYFAPVDPESLSNRHINHYAISQPRYLPISQNPLANSGMSPSIPGHATCVPTGRLIELDTPLPVVNYERNLYLHTDHSSKSQKSRSRDIEIDEVDFRRSQSGEDYARVDKKPDKKFFRNNEDGKNNDWEFVYKSLESVGYSKDLGEREDVLRKREMEARNSSRTQQKSSRSLVNVEVDEKHGTRSRDEKRRVNSGVRGTNFNECDVNGVFRKKGSLELQDSNAATSEIKKYSNTLPNSRAKSENSGLTKNSELVKNNGKSGKATEGRWNCAYCTFLNPYGREVCEICGKSRKKGNEDKPLASGGKECPQCTLVNERNAASCEACTASLKDSPTYI